MELRGTYKCGHIGAIVIPDLHKDNAKKEGNHFDWLCPKCMRENMLNRAIMQALERKLPELKGVKNQVLCGTIRRMEAIDNMDRMVNCIVIPGTEKEKVKLMKDFNRSLKSETDAGFWCDDVSCRLIDKFIEAAKISFLAEEDQK